MVFKVNGCMTALGACDIKLSAFRASVEPTAKGDIVYAFRDDETHRRVVTVVTSCYGQVLSIGSNEPLQCKNYPDR